MLYEEYKVWGPYTRKSDGRSYMKLVLKADRNVRTTLSYPKYLMEMLLGRYLNNDEHVDHIDGNLSNSYLSNLQILTPEENSLKAAIFVEIPYVDCVWCGEEFKPTRAQYEKRSVDKAGPFCGRRCSGSYGASVQNGGTTLDRGVVHVKHFHCNNNYIKEYVSI